MSDKAFFVGGHAALDFLNTIAAPRGEMIESIANGEAYVRWLADAGLLDRAEILGILKQFGNSRLDSLAEEARDLREWFRQVRATAGSTGRHTANVVAKLNQILAMDSARRTLDMSGGQLVFTRTT